MAPQGVWPQIIGCPDLQEGFVVIRSLSDHPKPYVVVAELAEYWGVSRRQIYTLVQMGALEAIRLGPRLLRIRTRLALAFERSARVASAEAPGLSRLALPSPRTRSSLLKLVMARPVHHT